MAEAMWVGEEYRLQEWAQVHRQCKESGLSNREFCRQKGISEKSFYYWLKKLRESAKGSQPQLVALHDGAGSVEEMIHIRFGAAVLDLPAKTDVDAIALLLQSLQEL